MAYFSIIIPVYNRLDEVRDLLGVPSDQVTWCLIPVGHPLGTWAEPKRKPVSRVTYLDHWDTPFEP